MHRITVLVMPSSSHHHRHHPGHIKANWPVDTTLVFLAPTFADSAAGKEVDSGIGMLDDMDEVLSEELAATTKETSDYLVCKSLVLRAQDPASQPPFWSSQEQLDSGRTVEKYTKQFCKHSLQLKSRAKCHHVGQSYNLRVWAAGGCGGTCSGVDSE